MASVPASSSSSISSVSGTFTLAETGDNVPEPLPWLKRVIMLLDLALVWLRIWQERCLQKNEILSEEVVSHTRWENGFSRRA